MKSQKPREVHRWHYERPVKIIDFVLLPKVLDILQRMGKLSSVPRPGKTEVDLTEFVECARKLPRAEWDEACRRTKKLLPPRHAFRDDEVYANSIVANAAIIWWLFQTKGTENVNNARRVKSNRDIDRET